MCVTEGASQLLKGWGPRSPEWPNPKGTAKGLAGSRVLGSLSQTLPEPWAPPKCMLVGAS